MIPTGWQIREGRELIGMSQADLAEAAGAGLAVVFRAELAAHVPAFTRRDAIVIQMILEVAGVEFVRENGGIGVHRQPTDKKDGGV